MKLETVTLKLPPKLLDDAGVVASGQDVTIGHLVRHLLAKEVARRLHPKPSNRAADALVAALQALLARDFAEATGWRDLATRLARHGYELRPAGGGIALYKRSCGTRVCKGSEIGFGYGILVRRFRAAMPGHPHGTLGQCFDTGPLEKPAPEPFGSAPPKHHLAPLFETAPDWAALTEGLRKQGYYLRPQGTGLAIYGAKDGRHLCNTAAVGFRYRKLVKRFGAPMPGHPHGQQWIKKNAVVQNDDALEFEVIDTEWRPLPTET